MLSNIQGSAEEHAGAYRTSVFRLTTCVENLEMSGSSTDVREMFVI